MRSKLTLLMILSSLALTAVSSAGDWSHINFPMDRSSTAKNGEVQVSVDYVANFRHDPSYKPQHRYSALPLYVNVRGAKLTGNEQVRVVLNNTEQLGNVNAAPWTYTLDLSWQGDHFSGSIEASQVNRSYMNLGAFHSATTPLVIRTTGYGGTRKYAQTLAIVIDGDWLKVPGTQQSDRDLDLFSQAGLENH